MSSPVRQRQRPPASGPPAVACRPRWCPATRVLVVLAMGWLLFTGLHRMFTGRWWVWLLPDLLPPLAYLAVPAALAAGVPLARLVRRPVPARPRTVVLAAAGVALLLGLPDAGLNRHAVGTALGSDAADPAPPDAIRVVSWNTGYWDQTDDRADFLAFLVAQRADVYLLQEYLYWDAAAGLLGARAVDDLARLRQAFPGFTAVARGELLTLSRYPVLASVTVGPDAAPSARAGRSTGAAADPVFERVFTTAKVLRTDLAVGSQVLSTYNVHLPVQVNLAATRDFLDFVAERDAARRSHLRALEADVAGRAEPVLVAGDLNTTAAMGDLRVLRHRLADAADAGTAGYPASWPTGRWPALWRLDWALHSAGVRVHRYALREPGGRSDHRIQQLTISLPEA